MGNVHRKTQLIHAAHHLDAKLAETAGVTLHLAVTDVILAVVGKAGQPHTHTMERIQPGYVVADGQVLQRRHEAHLSLLPGRINFVGIGYLNHVLLPTDVGQHQPHLGQHVVKLDERHIRVVDQPAEHIGCGHCRPPALFHCRIRPCVSVGAQVLGKPAHVLGQGHRVLVDIHHNCLFRQPPVARFLLAVQGHPAGWHPVQFLCQWYSRQRHGRLLAPVFPPRFSSWTVNTTLALTGQAGPGVEQGLLILPLSWWRGPG